MKSFLAVFLIVASASAGSSVVRTENGHTYHQIEQDQPAAIPYTRAFRPEQHYSGVPVFPIAYPGINRQVQYSPVQYQGSPAQVQPGSYIAADRPVTYAAAQHGYQAVVPGVQPFAYSSQQAYVQPAYVPGHPAYVH